MSYLILTEKTGASSPRSILETSLIAGDDDWCSRHEPLTSVETAKEVAVVHLHHDSQGVAAVEWKVPVVRCQSVV